MVETIWIIAGVGAAAAIGYALAKPAMPAITVAAPKMPDVAGAISAGITPFKEFATKSVETIKETTKTGYETIAEAIKAIPETVKVAIPKIPEIPKVEMPEIPEIPFIGQLKEIGGKWYEWTGAGWEWIQEKAEENAAKLTGAISDGLDKLGEGLKGLGSAITKPIRDVGQPITTIAGAGIGALGGAKIGATLGAPGGPIGMVIGGLFGGLLGWLIW